MNSFITENNLIDFFEHEGKIFLDAHRSAGTLEAAPGKEIYYELYRARAERSPDTPPENIDFAGGAEDIFKIRGVVVLCHGYTETCTKYHEMIYYLLRHGYHVLAFDHRGHGRSFRETKNPSKVHASDFDAEYVSDLNLLMQKVVRKAFPGLPLFLYGHSMGGCIAARYIELYPEVFTRCILSSPMLGIKTRGVPLILTRALARFMKCIGLGQRYIIGMHNFRPDETFETSSSTSRARFDRYNEIRKATPELQLSGGDYSWLYAALSASSRAASRAETAKIKTPLLLFEAENDVHVPRRRIAAFCRRLPSALYRTYTGTKHEIYSSPDAVAKAYYEEILRFLGT